MDQKLSQQQKLENRLDDILSPVDPEKNYVENLYHRLTIKPSVSIEYPNYFLFYVILSAGFFIGVLFIWLLTRIKFNQN